LKEKLLSGEIHFGFIWDPDGDRYNIVTIAPASVKNRLRRAVLRWNPSRGGMSALSISSQSDLFLNAALKLEILAESGDLFKNDQ